MSKVYGKTIVIHDDTLFGNFITEDYENCTLLFKNCTFIDFVFRTRANVIEFLGGNKFCESITLDAPKVIMREKIDMENLESLSINGGYFKMVEGMNIKAAGDILITSDIQSLKNNRVESLSAVTLQSSYGNTVYHDCRFSGHYGVKISALRGDLRLEDCEMEARGAKVRELEEEHMNGVYLSCYGRNAHMHILNSVIKTDVLEVNHPNYMNVHNTDLYKIGEHGRFLSRNQENPREIISHSYIDGETLLDSFYKTVEVEKTGKLKILELFGSAFKKSAG